MFSVIICSADDVKLNSTISMYARVLAGHPHEILAVRGPQSLASGYNLALDRASGEFVILSHDDVEIISPDFAERVSAHLGEHDLVGVAGTTRLIHPIWYAAGPPYIFGQVAHAAPGGQGLAVDIYGAPGRVVCHAQALDGLFLAMRASVRAALRFDEARFDGFHLYDIDFSFSAYLAGLKTAVCTDIHLVHASVGQYDTPWASYAERFLAKYAGRLINDGTLRKYQWAVVHVSTREEASQVMSYFPDCRDV